jgi:hypothetical protein
VQAVIFDPDDEGHRVVATATWTGSGVDIDVLDEDRGADVARCFRPTSVLTGDASYRSLGTSGDVQVPPGSLEWFRAAALTRVPAETGLGVRLVPGLESGGYDPAAGYRPFEEQMERLDRATRPSP